MKRRKTIHLRAVGLIEDGSWCAVCLETGYRGYGDSFAAALADLVAATECALRSVRAHHEAATAIFNGGPAAPRYRSMYQRAVLTARRPSAVFPVAA